MDVIYVSNTQSSSESLTESATSADAMNNPYDSFEMRNNFMGDRRRGIVKKTDDYGRQTHRGILRDITAHERIVELWKTTIA